MRETDVFSDQLGLSKTLDSLTNASGLPFFVIEGGWIDVDQKSCHLRNERDKIADDENVTQRTGFYISAH